MEIGDFSYADERERNLWQKLAKGEVLPPDDRAFLDQRQQERVSRLDAARAELRVGNSARARFYRLKDETLGNLGLPSGVSGKFGPVMQALQAYQAKKRSAPEDKPVLDEDGEVLFRAYGLLRWTMKALDDDETDEEAFEISRQCFELMTPIALAFVPRWV